MDNERFTLDKQSFKIMVVGTSAGHINGTALHLALEAILVYEDAVLAMEDTFTITGRLEHDYLPTQQCFPYETSRRRARGGGDYDRIGRRR
jgi:hypothetical protein